MGAPALGPRTDAEWSRRAAGEGHHGLGAAFFRAAGAPDVAAAGMGAALTPADAQQEDDKEGRQADDNHEQPVCGDMRAGPEPEAWRNRDVGTGGRGRRATPVCKAYRGSCSPSPCWSLHARGWGAAPEGCPLHYNPGQPQG